MGKPSARSQQDIDVGSLLLPLSMGFTTEKPILILHQLKTPSQQLTEQPENEGLKTQDLN